MDDVYNKRDLGKKKKYTAWELISLIKEDYEKKIIVRGPVMSRSGYGEQSVRFVFEKT